MNRPLQDRAVIVTGAGRGLGRAYAADIARAGGLVVVNDVDETEARGVVDLIRAAGHQAVPSGHDVSDGEQVDDLIETCRREFGAVHGLVNNAGRYHEAAPWEETPDGIAAIVSVNVLGAVYCLSAASRAMARNGGGSIVNATSGGMFGFSRVSTYAASKGALASLTYAAALDLEEVGVRVNAISPMAITRMTEGALGRESAPSGAGPGTGRAPLAGIEDMRPERVAPLVTYLLSDAAADITGQVLRFDGARIAVVPTVPLDDYPAVTRECWDVDAIAVAFDAELGGQLSPYGVQRRLPPRRRAG